MLCPKPVITKLLSSKTFYDLFSQKAATHQIPGSDEPVKVDSSTLINFSSQDTSKMKTMTVFSMAKLDPQQKDWRTTTLFENSTTQQLKQL
jgi:hypothetical protein